MKKVQEVTNAPKENKTKKEFRCLLSIVKPRPKPELPSFHHSALFRANRTLHHQLMVNNQTGVCMQQSEPVNQGLCRVWLLPFRLYIVFYFKYTIVFAISLTSYKAVLCSFLQSNEDITLTHLRFDGTFVRYKLKLVSQFVYFSFTYFPQ